MKKADFSLAKVHFIAGKGGVGKSLIYSALARFFSELGHKTLKVELCEDESLEGMRIPPIEKIGTNLYYLRIFPDHATYQYLRLKIPQKKLLDSLLGSKLFRALCGAMPGLSDLTRLGKIWFHADESLFQGQEIFDKIVVDLPSSGFIRRFLSVADTVSKAVRIGPLAKEAEHIHRYFIDANNALMHVVAVPEELIVKETQELILAMKKSHQVHLGWLFINRYPPYNHHELDSLKAKLEKNSGLYAYLQFMSSLTRQKEIEIKKLEELSLGTIAVPEFAGEVRESDVNQELVKAWEKLCD